MSVAAVRRRKSRRPTAHHRPGAAGCGQETAAADKPENRYMYRSRKQTPKGSQTHLYAETNDSLAGRPLAVNDRPSAPNDSDRRWPLGWLIGNLDATPQKAYTREGGPDRSRTSSNALPDASDMSMLASKLVTRISARLATDSCPEVHSQPRLQSSFPHGTSPRGHAGLPGDRCHRAPHRADRWHSFRDVNFGWGIIGRLDKGGRFLVQRADAGEGCGITTMNLKTRERS